MTSAPDPIHRYARSRWKAGTIHMRFLLQHIAACAGSIQARAFPVREKRKEELRKATPAAWRPSHVGGGAGVLAGQQVHDSL